MGSQQAMTDLSRQIAEATSQYEAEKKVVAELQSEAEARGRELERLKETLKEEEEGQRHEMKCEAELETNSQISNLSYEVRRLETQVERLRLQREEKEKIENENKQYESELESMTKQQNEKIREHAEAMHTTQKELLQLRHNLQVTFRQSLDTKIREHYRWAFQKQLSSKEKQSLEYRALLKEEQLYQQMGLKAVDCRNKLESEQISAYLTDVKRLHSELASCAQNAAKVRQQHESSQKLATHLQETISQLTKQRDYDLNQAKSLLCDTSSPSLESAITELDHALQDTRRQVEEATTLSELWHRRARTLNTFLKELRRSQDGSHSLLCLEQTAQWLNSEVFSKDTPSQDDDTLTRLTQCATDIRACLQAWTQDDFPEHSHFDQSKISRPPCIETPSAHTAPVQRIEARSISTASLPKLSLLSSCTDIKHQASLQSTSLTTKKAKGKLRQKPQRAASNYKEKQNTQKASPLRCVQLPHGTPAVLGFEQQRVLKALASFDLQQKKSFVSKS